MRGDEEGTHEDEGSKRDSIARSRSNWQKWAEPRENGRSKIKGKKRGRMRVEVRGRTEMGVRGRMRVKVRGRMRWG